MTDDVKAIREQRGAVYGDPQVMHDNIARVWTAQLRARYGESAPELDAQMAELMMAGFKVVRASRPVPDDPKARENYLDSFPDATNYLNFAREAVETEPEYVVIHMRPVGPIKMEGNRIDFGEVRVLADHEFVPCAQDGAFCLFGGEGACHSETPDGRTCKAAREDHRSAAVDQADGAAR